MTQDGLAATQDPAPARSEGTMERRKQIMKFLFRYRNSGVFSGLGQDALREEATVEDGTPAQFSRDLEALGPTFIKLGQMLSTRPDIVPPSYATALERMQEEVSPVPVEQIRQALEADLGVRLSKVFQTFDPEPLGTASLARCTARCCAMARRWRSRCRSPGWPSGCCRTWPCCARSPGPPIG